MTKKHRTTKYDTKLRGRPVGPEQGQQLAALLAEVTASEAPRPMCEKCKDILGDGPCAACAAERVRRAQPDAQTRRAMERTRNNTRLGL